MKRKLSLIVLVAMLAVVCFGVLAACDGLGDESLTSLLAVVKNQYSKAQHQTTYTLPSVVSFTDVDEKEISCDVVWTTNKEEGIEIKQNDDSTVTVTVSAGIESYILTGTLVDKNGKAYKLEGNPVSDSVTVSGSGVNPNPNPNPNPTPSGEKGTQGNPYTVAEALTIINGLTGEFSTSAVYVQGIVSGNVQTSTKTANTYNFDLVDAAGDTDKLIIWWALYTNGTPAAGDTAVIYGYLQKFTNNSGTKAEMNTNAGVTLTISSLTKGSGTVTPTPTPTPTPSGTLLATLTLTRVAPTSSDDNQKTYVSNGITLTNVKGNSTVPINTNDEPSARFYAASTIKFEYTTAFTTIVITADDYSGGKYMTAFEDMKVAGATITTDGAIITIVLDSPATSFTSGELKYQFRIKTVEIYG